MVSGWALGGKAPHRLSNKCRYVESIIRPTLSRCNDRNMTFRFTRRIMPILALLCCHCHIKVSCTNQKQKVASPPKEVRDVFESSWIRNHTSLQEIHTALQTGKIVVIHNAFKPDIYKSLQSEMISARYAREPRSTSPSDIKEIIDSSESSAFFDVPPNRVCDAVDRLR